jgi:hypothetical protein
LNLRTVHFFLILLSALLAVVFGSWLLRGYARGGGVLAVVGALASFAVAVGLILYDRWFLRKTKELVK